MKRYYGIPGIFGGQDFYDMNDKLVGYSLPSFFGGQDYFFVEDEMDDSDEDDFNLDDTQ